MKRKLWIVLLLVSLGVNAGVLLHWVWPRIPGEAKDGMASGWHAGPMKRHLGLSSEQAQRMEGEHRQVLAQAKPLQDALGQKRRELFVLLQRQEVREADLDVTLNEIARLQAAIEKVFVLHSLKVRSVFSPEQLRKYDGCLERGLCPGMAASGSCLPGGMAGPGAARSGCGNTDEAKK